MSKKPFEEMDPELKALRASMRPTASPLRWGRVLTGILVVSCVGFAFAYYLPLARAHETLAKRFLELQSQVASANRAVERARGEAKELSEKVQALEGQSQQAEQLEKARSEASRSLAGALTAKLHKQLGKDQAAVGIAGGRAMAALSLGYVLSRGKLDVSPQGQGALCDVASASNKRTIGVVAVADKKSIPASLSKTLKTPLDYSSAVAALVAQTLLDKCRVDPAQLSATGVPSEPAANPKLEGQQLKAARVELWLEGAQ